MNRAKAPLLLALVFSAVALPALAGGVIQGEITNALTKDPVSGARITLTAPELGSPRAVTANDSGVYRFADLPPGAYSLSVEATEYKPFTRSDVALRGDRTLRVNLPLLPSDLSKY